jgi:hypothetical protein
MDRIGTRSVYIEAGRQKVFACSLEWPGWARAAKTEDAALQLLTEYAARYAVVAARAGIPFDAEKMKRFEVAERLPGSATTDFGAIDAKPAADHRPLTTAGAERLAVLVKATWTIFDKVVVGAPIELRKGPRGGGRDRNKIVEHVLGAEASYVRKIGLRLSEPKLGDTKAIKQFRSEVLTTLRSARGSDPFVERGWPPRYAARRIAWHVLDHAWEIQDRSS